MHGRVAERYVPFTQQSKPPLDRIVDSHQWFLRVRPQNGHWGLLLYGPFISVANNQIFEYSNGIIIIEYV